MYVVHIKLIRLVKSILYRTRNSVYYMYKQISKVHIFCKCPLGDLCKFTLTKPNRLPADYAIDSLCVSAYVSLTE